MLHAAVSSCTGYCHSSIVALRRANWTRASSLHDVAHKSAQLAAFISLSILIPPRAAGCCLLGELRKDDLVHHGDVAFGTVASPNVKKPRSFQSQRPERLLPILGKAVICKPSLHSFGGPLGFGNGWRRGAIWAMVGTGVVLHGRSILVITMVAAVG